MLILFYVLLFAQILQGAYNLWDGLRWLQMARARAASPAGFYVPRVALICPVKGLEPDLSKISPR
jgi:hypothetical protein